MWITDKTTVSITKYTRLTLLQFWEPLNPTIEECYVIQGRIVKLKNWERVGRVGYECMHLRGRSRIIFYNEEPCREE